MNGSRLESALQRLTQRSVPGLAAVMVERGDVVEASAAGLRDITTGSPTTLDTVHLWFSMTKIVTTTAAMQLAERGALSLDDRVARFVPQCRRSGFVT